MPKNYKNMWRFAKGYDFLGVHQKVSTLFAHLRYVKNPHKSYQSSRNIKEQKVIINSLRFTVITHFTFTTKEKVDIDDRELLGLSSWQPNPLSLPTPGSPPPPRSRVLSPPPCPLFERELWREQGEDGEVRREGWGCQQESPSHSQFSLLTSYFLVKTTSVPIKK